MDQIDDIHFPDDWIDPTSPGDGADSGDALGQLYDCLHHRRRRLVLVVLARHDEALAVADIARELVEREHDAPLEDVPAADVERAHISLHHVHVPKLADAGLLRYDRSRAVVALTADAATLDERLPAPSSVRVE